MASEDLKGLQFRVRWFEEKNQWMGQCPSYSDLAAFADEPLEAIRGIMNLVQARIEAGTTAEDKSVFKSMDDMLSGAPGPFGRMG